MRPFKQITISEGVFIREFSGDVDTEELVWHRDQEDRLITVTESAGWQIQRDNEMPVEMKAGDQFFIPALEWHRVIKGDGSLMIEVDTKAKHPKQYGAPQGSKRDKQLDQTKKDFEKAKPFGSSTAFCDSRKHITDISAFLQETMLGGICSKLLNSSLSFTDWFTR